MNETEIVKQYSRNRSYTIVHGNWAMQAFAKKELNHQIKLEILPFQVYCLSKNDEEALRYKSHQNLILYNIENSNEKILSLLKDHKVNIDSNIYREINSLSSFYNIFKGIKCYFKGYNFKNSKYLKAKMIYISRGGIETPLKDCNLVITNNLEDDFELCQSELPNLHYSWILEMIE